MNRQRFLHRFELDNHSVANEQIHSERRLEHNSLVLHAEIDLALEGNVAQVQLVAERVFIGRFEQTRAKHTVDFDRSAQDLLSQCLFAQHGKPSVISTNFSVLRDLHKLLRAP